MIVGRRVLRLEEVTSTNDVAKRLGQGGRGRGSRRPGQAPDLGSRSHGEGLVLARGRPVPVRAAAAEDARPKQLLRMTVFSCVPVAKAIEEVSGIRRPAQMA